MEHHGLNTIPHVVSLAAFLLFAIPSDIQSQTFDPAAISFRQTPLNSYGGQWQSNSQSLKVIGSPAKLLIGEQEYDDFELSVELKAGQKSQAGVIFRVNNIAEGIDQYDGYYIGIDAARNSVIWGSANRNWMQIAQRPASTPAEQWHKIRIVARGHDIQAWVDQMPLAGNPFPKFDGIDHQHSIGRIGFRSLGGSAEFRNLKIAPASPHHPGPSYTNPIQANVADPAVLQHQGTYYLYCTHSADHPTMPRGIRLYRSKNMVHWEDQGFVIKREQSWGKTRFWAPDIIERDGEFYLYYAADTRICVAKAKHPLGPFQELPQSPMVPESVRIDAHVFQDGDKTYFYYVHFNRGNEIWGGELKDDMVTLKAETLRLMIQPDQPWERHQAAIAEGPVILKHEGTYYLTYSGSHFESPEYAVGYATSDSPLGPWKKYEHNPIMKSTAYAHGTAHHCFASSPDGTEKFIVYHRHRDLMNTEPRQLSIDRIQFTKQAGRPDKIEIHGPTSTPQSLPSGSH